MKLPGWLEMVPQPFAVDKDSHTATFVIRIRRWHPYVWWMVTCVLVQRLLRGDQ